MTPTGGHDTIEQPAVIRAYAGTLAGASYVTMRVDLTRSSVRAPIYGQFDIMLEPEAAAQLAAEITRVLRRLQLG